MDIGEQFKGVTHECHWCGEADPDVQAMNVTLYDELERPWDEHEAPLHEKCHEAYARTWNDPHDQAARRRGDDDRTKSSIEQGLEYN